MARHTKPIAANESYIVFFLLSSTSGPFLDDERGFLELAAGPKNEL